MKCMSYHHDSTTDTAGIVQPYTLVFLLYCTVLYVMFMIHVCFIIQYLCDRASTVLIVKIPEIISQTYNGT